MKRNTVVLVVQAILCVLVVVTSIAAVVGIYAEGVALKATDPLHRIFTRELMQERFAPLVPLIACSLAVTVAGWALGIRDERADAPVKDAGIACELACARVGTPSGEMEALRLQRRRLAVGGWVAFAACMVPIVLYAANAALFAHPEDTELDIAALVATFVPWVVAGIASLAVTGMLQEGCAERETQAAKARVKEERDGGVGVSARPLPVRGALKALPRPLFLSRTVMVLIALLLIVYGILNGGLDDVLAKATGICSECVGLG